MREIGRPASIGSRKTVTRHEICPRSHRAPGAETHSIGEISLPLHRHKRSNPSAGLHEAILDPIVHHLDEVLRRRRNTDYLPRPFLVVIWPFSLFPAETSSSTSCPSKSPIRPRLISAGGYIARVLESFA